MVHRDSNNNKEVSLGSYFIPMTKHQGDELDDAISAHPSIPNIQGQPLYITPSLSFFVS